MPVVQQWRDTVRGVQLLLAVATINVWNRLAISTHQELAEPA